MEPKTQQAKRNPFARKLSFPLGGTVMTPGAMEVLEPDELVTFVARHARGDWGEVPDGDWKENDFSVEQGYRILSVYTSRRGEKVWVITEADRSATTVLLPEEY